MLRARYFILLICLSFLLKAEAKVTLTSIWGVIWCCSNNQRLLSPERQLRENACKLSLHGIIKKSKRMLIQKVNGNLRFKHREPEGHTV